MKGYHGCWMRAVSLLMLVTETCLADDFLYVVATPPGRPSEIHWVPTKAPQSARVLVEELEMAQRVYRHRGELWWWDPSRWAMGNLVGQNADEIGNFGDFSFTDMVRQGDMVYWINGSELGSYRLSTGERKVILNEGVSFNGLDVYHDRLYFGIGTEVQTTLLNGAERVVLGDGDPRLRWGTRDLVVHDGRVLWLSGERLVQVDLETGERSNLGEELAGSPFGMAAAMTVTREAIYWVNGSAVWRWRHGESEHESIYELGDVRLTAISAISAHPQAVTVGGNRGIQVRGEEDEIYQLLYSEDLRSWSPDFVQRSLFSASGFLEWLDPLPGVAGELTTWQPRAVAREAYFSAWQYDLGPAFDEDGDELPDYWERRHFGDLSALPNDDSNGDGVSHLDESLLFLSPSEIDSDGDGLTDAEELLYDPPLNAGTKDTDGDTLTDGEEVNLYGSDPHSVDTDADGYTDDFELAFGGDFNDASVLPVSARALAPYAGDLMIHFDFEEAEGAILSNRGALGGVGQVVGKASYITRDRSAGEPSTALDFPRDPGAPTDFGYVKTDYALADAGLSAPADRFTVTLWLKVARVHTGTVFSAGQPGSRWQVIELRAEGARFDPVSKAMPLEFTFTSNSADGTPIGNIWSSGRDLSTDEWQHVSWVIENGRSILYINGIRLHGREAFERGPLAEDALLWFGARREVERANGPFHGAMDDVRVYREALPENVIKVLAR